MWVPTTEQEILAAIASGDTEETPSFDAKQALPAKGKSKDLAKDVAAMSADGGTLLYGIAEDMASGLQRRTATVQACGVRGV